MKRAERSDKITKIRKRLSEISELERAIFQPQSSKPVTISLNQLSDYEKLFEERELLIGQLTDLASEKIED